MITRSKLSSKVLLLVGGIGLSIASFAGQPAAAAQSYCPTSTVYDAGVGYYGYYYGDPYSAYGTVKRWGAPIYDHGSMAVASGGHR